jgi:hypothetical protein
MKQNHPKQVPYPKARDNSGLVHGQPEATYVPLVAAEKNLCEPDENFIDSIAITVFSSAAGAYIRDVAHRSSVPEIEFEKMARMAIQAAKLFRKTQESDASS